MDRRDILSELSKAIARGGPLKNMALPCFLWVTGQLPLPPGSADLLTQPSPPRGARVFKDFTHRHDFRKSKKTRGTPVMPECLSARLRPDEAGLPLPDDSNMHQRRRHSSDRLSKRR